MKHSSMDFLDIKAMIKSLSNKKIDDGIFIQQLSNDADFAGFLTFVKPGVSSKPHYHKEGIEIYHVLSGEGLLQTWQKDNAKVVDQQKIAKGHFYNIAPNVVHQIKNKGSEDLKMMFFCDPKHISIDRVEVRMRHEK